MAVNSQMTLLASLCIRPLVHVNKLNIDYRSPALHIATVTCVYFSYFKGEQHRP